MVRKFLFLIFLVFFSSAFGSDLYKFNYFNFQDENLLASYSFEVSNFNEDDLFKVDLYDGENFISNKCSSKIFSSNIVYYKYNCVLSFSDKINDPLLKSYIIRDGVILDDSVMYVPFNFNDDGLLYYDFKVVGNSTIVSINLNTSDDPVRIYSEIPKSVIEYLDENNMNNLISSEIKFEIIKNDPLIAWNLESTPESINYTIKKEVSIDEQKYFKLNAIRDNPSFSFLNKLALVLVFLILFLIFKKSFFRK